MQFLRAHTEIYPGQKKLQTIIGNGRVNFSRYCSKPRQTHGIIRNDLFDRLTQCVSVNLKADSDSISTDPNLWNLEVVKASVTAK